MKVILPIIFLVLLLKITTPLQKFCSMVCKNSGCNGNTLNDCNGNCQSNWIVSGSTCIPNAGANWHYEDQTVDVLGGTVAVTAASGYSGCGSFSLYGPLYSTATVGFTLRPITIPYYQMIVYVGVISVDSGGSGGGSTYWPGAAITYFLTFTNTMQVTSLALRSSINQEYCFSNTRRQRWNRITQMYTYNVTATQLDWTLTNNQSSNLTALWGVKQFIVITRRCHWACAECYGSLATQCYSCITNWTVTIWQSNYTCNESCLTRFGEVSIPNICVYCDLKCTACFDLPTICSACTRSGIWIAYLLGTDCLPVCPDGYFANKTTQTCDLCTSNCSLCLNTGSYCLSCISPTAWTGWSCYDPCPLQYYLETATPNCTKCDKFCDVCIGPSTVCTVCVLSGVYKAYLYNTTNNTGSCLRICPIAYYSQSYGGLGPNLCLPCNASCTICTANPTPCQQCAVGYYLYVSTCISPCPNGTFQDNSTGYGLCLDCNVVCVGLTINMYFPTILNQKLYIDMIFSQQLDFTLFNITEFQEVTVTSQNIQYSLSMFTMTYQIISKNQYRIILEPKSYIFLYNATFSVLTRATTDPADKSLLLMPFKPTNYMQSASINWFLIHGPPFSALEKGVMNTFSTLSTKTNYFLTLPYVQQFKKSGIFNLLFSGAQITSCSVLSNQIQSQNLYEGVRFWAIFVFFDVPPYEKISDKTKNFINPTVQDQIRNAQQIDESDRQLFSTDTMYWRFQRTGQTSFFIYDVYMPIFLIITCWVLMFIARKCKQKKWHFSFTSKIYSIMHKIHEISIIYITMAAIVQFIYFTPTSSERIISMIICIIFNVYFIGYELYIYYDMIRYPMAQIGNKVYDYYVLYYGSFLKNIRFEQYDINQKWSPKHWFRPYNYHILSYYKKFIMIITMPLFYSTVYAQMTILLIVQISEVIRFWIVWPFISKRRNWLRLSLQISLMFFFLFNIIQINLLNIIMSTSDKQVLGSTIQQFYGIGWAGFALCFYFNISHIIIGLYDFCVGLKVTNRQKMDAARKKYYYNKIKDYEKDNQASSKVLVNKWVKLGNLNNRSYGELPELNVRIQQYKMRRVGQKFQVQMKKITSLKMKNQKNYRKNNNTTSGGKIELKFFLNQSTNYALYNILDAVYKQFEGPHPQVIILKTFLNVEQKKFKQGQQIKLDRNNMFQRVELISYDNDKQQIELPNLLEGFPLQGSLFDSLK